MSQPSLQKGDEGPPVSALQLALAALGFDTGAVDGAFGTTTEAAVLRFQESQGMAASGVVDDDTWAALGSQSFDPSQVTQVSAAEFPSIARAIFFGADIDAYLQDLGIDSATISDDDDLVG
jgi:peptidoglycan hydrolase-like protein with peptidoglycan-binding domain